MFVAVGGRFDCLCSLRKLTGPVSGPFLWF